MKRGERGFTLIEVIISVAIMATIMGAITMTTIPLLTNPQRSSNYNIALQQVQNVGYWISRDVQMAKTVTPDVSGGFPLTLVIPVDTNPGNDQSVSYSFDGNNLERQVNGSAETLIAQYIDVAATTFSMVDANTYKLTVKASIGEAVVERSYEVTQRLVSE